MATGLATFDRSSVAVAWFDPSADAGGWLDSELVADPAPSGGGITLVGVGVQGDIPSLTPLTVPAGNVGDLLVLLSNQWYADPAGVRSAPLWDRWTPCFTFPLTASTSYNYLGEVFWRVATNTADDDLGGIYSGVVIRFRGAAAGASTWGTPTTGGSYGQVVTGNTSLSIAANAGDLVLALAGYNNTADGDNYYSGTWDSSPVGVITPIDDASPWTGLGAWSYSPSTSGTVNATLPLWSGTIPYWSTVALLVLTPAAGGGSSTTYNESTSQQAPASDAAASGLTAQQVSPDAAAGQDVGAGSVVAPHQTAQAAGSADMAAGSVSAQATAKDGAAGRDVGFDTVSGASVAPSFAGYAPLASGGVTNKLVGGYDFLDDLPVSLAGGPCTWSVTPALPLGLSLDASTGRLSGTPNVDTAATTYTVRATNAAGHYDVAFIVSTIQSVDPLAYPLRYGTNPVDVWAGASGTKAPVTIKNPWVASVDPAYPGTTLPIAFSPSGLPAGLTVNMRGDVVGGVDYVPGRADGTMFSCAVWGSNDFWNEVASLDLRYRVLLAPTGLSYGSSPLVLRKWTAVSLPASYAGAGPNNPTTFTVSPTLPAGLSLDAATGALSGAPTVVQANADYLFTATNSEGTYSVTIPIGVTQPAADVADSWVVPETKVGTSLRTVNGQTRVMAAPDDAFAVQGVGVIHQVRVIGGWGVGINRGELTGAATLVVAWKVDDYSTVQTASCLSYDQGASICVVGDVGYTHATSLGIGDSAVIKIEVNPLRLTVLTAGLPAGAPGFLAPGPADTIFVGGGPFVARINTTTGQVDWSRTPGVPVADFIHSGQYSALHDRVFAQSQRTGKEFVLDGTSGDLLHAHEVPATFTGPGYQSLNDDWHFGGGEGLGNNDVNTCGPNGVYALIAVRNVAPYDIRCLPRFSPASAGSGIAGGIYQWGPNRVALLQYDGVVRVVSVADPESWCPAWDGVRDGGPNGLAGSAAEYLLAGQPAFADLSPVFPRAARGVVPGPFVSNSFAPNDLAVDADGRWQLCGVSGAWGDYWQAQSWIVRLPQVGVQERSTDAAVSNEAWSDIVPTPLLSALDAAIDAAGGRDIGSSSSTASESTRDGAGGRDVGAAGRPIAESTGDGSTGGDVAASARSVAESTRDGGASRDAGADGYIHGGNANESTADGAGGADASVSHLSANEAGRQFAGSGDRSVDFPTAASPPPDPIAGVAWRVAPVRLVSRAHSHAPHRPAGYVINESRPRPPRGHAAPQ
jgi:hypothetical protein